MPCKILGCGAYLPEKIITNFDLAQNLDTTNEWIYSRTGILQRHIAQDMRCSDMALIASLEALKDANLTANELDLIIVCTTTADHTLPAVANKLQGALGLTKIPSFDLQAVCTGFIYGLEVASCMIKSNKYKNILLVCSEKMSSIVDWSDRSTCVLFGDGAGAVVLTKALPGEGLIDTKIYSNGSLFDILATDGGVSTNGASGVIKMRGPELYKNAIEKMSNAIRAILAAHNLTQDQVAYLIPHQANVRIIDSIAEKLNFDDKKVIKTVSKHANCSAASIPLALAEAQKLGKIKDGDIILFTAFGAGLTWGAALIRWQAK